MKEYVCLLAGVAFLAVACQKKETTVTNPSEENKTDTTIVDEAANTPVTNLPLEKKTETTTTTVNQSPTPSSDTTLPTESNTPLANESPASSETDTNLPAGNTTGGSAAIIGGSSSSSDGALPGATVNPAREALRRQIMQGARPSPTP